MAAAAFQFELPSSLNATMPPERRGVRRDMVRMMVLDRNTGRTSHSTFYQLDRFLKSGDLLVLNASRTVPAVFDVSWSREHGIVHPKLEIRLARRLDDATWEALPLAEGVQVGDRFHFCSELYATVIVTEHPPLVTLAFSQAGTQLYNHIYRLGEPIRYEYIDHPWTLDYYQTVFATAPGSVEMPSAGRAFSWELLFKLQRKGVRIAYVELHTGLSYMMDDRWHLEPADHYESYSIPQTAVEAIHQTKAAGGKVIAVGTTVVRSLESAYREHGRLVAGSGWTNLHINESFPLQAVDGLITGLHEPEASHLDLLSAFIRPEHLAVAYREAIELQYLWHEFGDMNLIV